MTVGLELDDLVCQLGDRFTGRLTRHADADGVLGDSPARSIQLVLRMYTEGRGDTDRRDVTNQNFDLEAHGGLNATFSLLVPETSPVSYDGTLMRVMYEIEARVDLKFARDEKSAHQVLVIPVGGLGVYDRPHPLPLYPS